MKKHFMRLLIAIICFALLSLQPAMAQNTTPYWSAAGNNNAGSAPKLGNTTAVALRLV